MGEIKSLAVRRQEFRTFLEELGPQMAMVLPKHITPERMVRIALTAGLANPRLFECTRESIAGAMLTASQWGLEPDGILGHGYLIPRKNRKRDVYEATFMPGYQGLIELGYRSGRIASVVARAVYANDRFSFYTDELGDHLRHEPNLAGDRGAFVAAYAIVRLKDGDPTITALPKSDIDRHRASSSARDDGPWQTHYAEMAVKTALRVAYKLAPKSRELAEAIAVEEQPEDTPARDIPMLQLTTDQQQALETPPPTPKPKAATKQAPVQPVPEEATHEEAADDVPSEAERSEATEDEAPGCSHDFAKERAKKSKAVILVCPECGEELRREDLLK